MKIRMKRNAEQPLKGIFLPISIAVCFAVFVMVRSVWQQQPGRAVTDTPTRFRSGMFKNIKPSEKLSFRGEKTTVSSQYVIAFEQSFGYFDDIPNEECALMRSIHNKAFPNINSPELWPRADYVKDGLGKSHKGSDQEEDEVDEFHLGVGSESLPGRAAKIKYAAHFHANNFHPEIHCRFLRRMPSTGVDDGPKWICDPHRISKQKECLVYSIGSHGETDFERSVREDIGKHCEIHTFDLDASSKAMGDYAENVKPYATFHHWGIGSEEDVRAGAAGGKPLKTLTQTLTELGHLNRTIDIFKIDCEGCEWSTVSDWLQYDLRQILVEVHEAPMPQARDFFHNLHDAGYMIYSKEANHNGGGSCVEYSFMRVSPLFFEGHEYKNMG